MSLGSYVRHSSLTSHDYMDLEERWCAHNYHPMPVVLSKGKGAWVWDVEGNRYLDMMSAYSAVSHGHAHPKILAALNEQASQLSICSRAYYNDVLPRFLQKLCGMLDLSRAMPMNTGAEAVETAIKAARRWGYFVKKIPVNQAEIIVTSNNFHGRTIGIISFSSDADYKKGFGPYLPGFIEVPFGDVQAIRDAITPYTCAVLTEAIQGEAGIVVPPAGWLRDTAALCQQESVLLIVDEIQSGLGRTGKLLACQHEQVMPDGVILGKALGGGVFPVSAFVGKESLLSVFTPGSHGSTFGGNPLGAAVALKALEILEEDRLSERSAELGTYFLEKLQAIQSPIVKDIRGKGLWIGLEIDPTYRSARRVCEDLMRLGVLSKETHETVVRLAPPLIITKQELDWGIEQIRKVL